MKRRSKASPSRRPPLGLRRHIRIVDLREKDDAAIVAEIVVAQLGKAIEAEPPDDQRVEMAGEKIREEERARLLLGEREKTSSPA